MNQQTLSHPAQPAASATSNARLSTPAVEPQQKVIRMTMAEWKRIHKDFKGIHRNPDGSIAWRSVLRPGGLVAVEIVK